MLVREVMSAPVVTVSADDSIRFAARLLLKHAIASMPVLDSDGRLVGIVSEADLLNGRMGPDPRAHLRPLAEADDDLPPQTVGEVMTPRVLSIDPRADVAEAARLLLDHGIKAVPVVEGSRVVGIVARRDLLRALARDDEDIRAEVVALLQGLGPAGREWDVDVTDGVVTLFGPHSAEDQRVAALLARTVNGAIRVRVDPATKAPL